MSFESGALISKTLKKRNFFKYLGVGALAGGVGLFAKQKAQAVGVPYVYMHGTSVEVERPDLTTSILRQGFYTTIQGKANTFNWFHFAIPTIVVTSNVQLTGGQVYFNTGSNNVKVQSVHLYVGSQKVGARDNLNLYGNDGFGYVTLNTPVSPYGAVGISVGVNFGAASPLYIQFLFAASTFNNLV